MVSHAQQYIKPGYFRVAVNNFLGPGILLAEGLFLLAIGVGRRTQLYVN
jgi:hypothetical protein